MKLTAACGRCGGPIEVEPQMVANAVALGQELEVEHAPGDCPNEGGVPVEEGAPLRRFRLQLMCVELPHEGSEEYERLGVAESKVADAMRWTGPELGADEDGTPHRLELMAGIGKTVAARNFPEAVNGELTGWLNDAWPRFQESAAFADLPTGGPVPSAEPVEQRVPVAVVPPTPSRLILPGQQ